VTGARRTVVAACVLGAAVPAALSAAFAASLAAAPSAAPSAASSVATAAPCALVLAEQRSGREVMRLPLDTQQPAAQVTFTHSVLGTPVIDRYVWRRDADRWRAHLVEERFEGEGYGLPIAAGPGETLTRDGAGWRLTLDRLVDPLVVRPSMPQGTRVQGGRTPAVALAELTTRPVELRVAGCDAQ
jgi:hypothetical protein